MLRSFSVETFFYPFPNKNTAAEKALDAFPPSLYLTKFWVTGYWERQQFLVTRFPRPLWKRKTMEIDVKATKQYNKDKHNNRHFWKWGSVSIIEPSFFFIKGDNWYVSAWSTAGRESRLDYMKDARLVRIWKNIKDAVDIGKFLIEAPNHSLKCCERAFCIFYA